MSSNGNYHGDEKWVDALSRGLKALEEVGIDGWLVESGNRRLLRSTTAPPEVSGRDLSTLLVPDHRFRQTTVNSDAYSL